jgi:glutamine amidotransferase
MVVIIDYDVGNVGSIHNMLHKIGANSIVSSDPNVISNATHIVLPGVGLFDVAMSKLEALKIIPILEKRVLADKIPILGICLGMQILTRGSEEGKLPGLGWIDGETIKFRNDANCQIRIPHMGWNIAKLAKKSYLFKNVREEQRFYFLHTYHVNLENNQDLLAETFYGYNFASAFQRDNIMGVQFHPEKSHKFGLEFFKNFMEQ